MSLRPSWGLYGNPPGPPEREELTRAERKAAKARSKAERVEKAFWKAAAVQGGDGEGRWPDAPMVGLAMGVTSRDGVRAARSVGTGANVTARADRPRAGGTASQGGEKATQDRGFASRAEENAAQHGASLAQGRGVTVDQSAEFHQELMRRLRQRMFRNTAIEGYAEQWNLSVAQAVVDLQSELGMGDVRQAFDGLCRIGQELFLRELKNKAVRILAHKKRKLKTKSSK
jgi:hypothetical protein